MHRYPFQDFTRREFLRTGAALGAGVYAATLPVGARAAARNAGVPIKVGVIGCGGRGTGATVNALCADECTILWAMGDAFGARIESSLAGTSEAMRERDAESGGTLWSDKVQVPPERRFTGLDAYRKVLESGVDMVILTTPPGFRPAHFVAAVEAGKHVFCEKPVAVDPPGVRAVLEASERARAKGLCVTSGFCWRYSTRERETYARVRAGAIGDIRAVYTTYNTTGWIEPQARRPEWSDTEFMLRNWHYFSPLSGDHIVEQAVHSIDKMAWAMGDEPPVRCWAVGGRQTRPDAPETGNVFDHFAVTYEWANGARGFHMCRHWPNTPSDNSDYIMGARGTCTVNGWTGTHRIDGEEPWECRSAGNDMYQQEHDDMIASIKAGTPINDGVSMCRSTLLAIMAREAAYTGQVITWEQAMNSNHEIAPRAWAWGPAPVPVLARPGVSRFA